GTLLQLAHDLHGDSNDLEELYPGWSLHRADVDIPALLASAVSSNALNEFIDGLTPKNPAYGQLARALVAYKAMAAAGDWPKVTEGSILAPGAHDARIKQIRARLTAENYLTKPSNKKFSAAYDEILQKAVAAYQERNGLKDDGKIGKKSVEAMNVSV